MDETAKPLRILNLEDSRIDTELMKGPFDRRGGLAGGSSRRTQREPERQCAGAAQHGGEEYQRLSANARPKAI